MPMELRFGYTSTNRGDGRSPPQRGRVAIGELEGVIASTRGTALTGNIDLAEHQNGIGSPVLFSNWVEVGLLEECVGKPVDG